MSDDRTSRLHLIAAFAAVYIIWGSTYLAIRFAIETLPPFLMAGTRFLVAGVLLYAWTRARGVSQPTRREWVGTGIAGALLLLGGNGAVVWAEQTVPSGVAALLVATLPLWMVLVDWARPGGVRPQARTMAGVVVGLGGVAMLVGPGDLVGGDPIPLIGSMVIVVGSLAWAIGSIYSKHAALPASPLLTTGMQMIVGGGLLFLLGLATGEAGRIDAGAVSLGSVLALVYLIFFGSIVAYTAYLWLLRNTTTARVSTYAYVNPVVAMLLGWALAGEEMTPRVLFAAAIIIGAVVVITTSRARRTRRPSAPRAPEPARRAA